MIMGQATIDRTIMDQMTMTMDHTATIKNHPLKATTTITGTSLLLSTNPKGQG